MSISSEPRATTCSRILETLGLGDVPKVFGHEMIASDIESWIASE